MAYFPQQYDEAPIGSVERLEMAVAALRAAAMPPQEALHEAASIGNLERLESALKAGADVNHLCSGATTMCRACLNGHAACARRLLAAGADASLRVELFSDQLQITTSLQPLHIAAAHDSAGSTECVAALLQAGADAWANFTQVNLLALHLAANQGSLESVRLLCQACHDRDRPAADGQPGAIQQPACLTTNGCGVRPLSFALNQQRMEIARYMVAEAPWGPQHTGEVLAVLVKAGARALPLFPALVARYPLTPEQWALVPSPCPGLGAALPAVVQRSEAEAALLVHHMTASERQHLRALALCLGAAQHRGCLPSLHSSIAERLLADCAAHFAAAAPEQQAAWCQAWSASRQRHGQTAGAALAGPDGLKWWQRAVLGRR